MRLAKPRANSASSSAATSSRCRSSVTEPPNSRSRASWSSTRPFCRARALTPGTSSSTASTRGRRCRWSKVSTDCWRKRRRIVSAMSCSSVAATRSTSKRRERSKVSSSPKKTPSSSSEPRGRPPPSSTMRSTRWAKPFRRSSRRGSSGSVMTAVLSVAKISASLLAAAAAAPRSRAGRARRRGVGASGRVLGSGGSGRERAGEALAGAVEAAHDGPVGDPQRLGGLGVGEAGDVDGGHDLAQVGRGGGRSRRRPRRPARRPRDRRVASERVGEQRRRSPAPACAARRASGR